MDEHNYKVPALPIDMTNIDCHKEDHSIHPSNHERLPTPSKYQEVNNEEEFSSSPSLSEDGSDFTPSERIAPPDGGWGWVIVFASFLCNVIVDGIIFSFGILFSDISTTFHTSKSTTATIGSLQAGCYLAIGPVVSGLANRYGCRRVTIIGSIIASLGFFASFWANSVFFLTVSFGIVGGVGFGLIYLPAIVLVGHYFEKKRAFATGISVCGSGIGAFVMAPFIQYLNNRYDWRGCVLVLSALILNCAVVGSLFRPLEESFIASEKPLIVVEEWSEDEEDDCCDEQDTLQETIESVTKVTNTEADSNHLSPIATGLSNAHRSSMPELERLFDQQLTTESVKERKISEYVRPRTLTEYPSISEVEIDITGEIDPQGSKQLPRTTSKNQILRNLQQWVPRKVSSSSFHYDILPSNHSPEDHQHVLPIVESLSESCEESKKHEGNQQIDTLVVSGGQMIDHSAESESSSVKHDDKADNLVTCRTLDDKLPLYPVIPPLTEHDNLNTEEPRTAMTKMNGQRNNESLLAKKDTTVDDETGEYEEKILPLTSKVDKLNRNKKTNKKKRRKKNDCWESFTRDLMKSLDPDLLYNPAFVLLVISGFLTLAGFFIPFTYIVDRAVILGIDEERSAYLLCIIGITNTVGRIVCGWLSDRPWVNALFINNIALVIGGGFTLLSPIVCNDFTMLALYGGFFGFSIACFATLRSVIIVELLGLDKLTNAFGLAMLPQGIAAVIGTPFAGWLYDVSGSYDSAFYVSGAVIMVSGLMCFHLKRIANWERKRRGGGAGDECSSA